MITISTLHISLLGKFQIQQGKRVVDGCDTRKIQELLCYLLLRREHPLPRETIAGLLWPDSPTAQSKKSLRQALWQLQSTVNAYLEDVDERLLIVEPDWIQLNIRANIWLDVSVFENAFVQSQNVFGYELDAPQAAVLQQAIHLYQGPLLEGWYEDWCLYERERLQNIYLMMLDKLMDYSEAHHDYETGLLYGVRILSYDRVRESTYCRLMRLHYLMGDRAAALRQFERCVAVLMEELNVRPSKRTIALHEQILRDQLDEVQVHAAPAPAHTNPDATSHVSARSLREMLDQLTYLHTTLASLQGQVQQNIEYVEHVLNPGRDTLLL